MRILFFTSSFPHSESGSESVFIKRLADEIMRLGGSSVTVLTPAVPGVPFRERFGAIEIIRFSYFWPFSWQRLTTGSILPQMRAHPYLILQLPFFLLASFWGLIRTVRSQRIDVIHAHWLLPQGFIAALYHRLVNRNIPVVCTVHGSDVQALTGRWYGALQRWALRNIECVCLVTNTMRSLLPFRGLSRTRVEVVSMGIDVGEQSPRQPSSADVSRFLFVGRLVPDKGVDMIISAFASVMKELPGATLTIVGEGAERTRLEQLSQETGASSRVHFLGAVSHAELQRTIYPGSDILVAASRTEGFGLIYLEALAAGLRVVATRVGVLTEIESQMIHIYDRTDNGDGLTHAMFAAARQGSVAEPGFRDRLITHYGWKAVASRYSAIYQSLEEKI